MPLRFCLKPCRRLASFLPNDLSRLIRYRSTDARWGLSTIRNPFYLIDELVGQLAAALCNLVIQTIQRGCRFPSILLASNDKRRTDIKLTDKFSFSNNLHSPTVDPRISLPGSERLVRHTHRALRYADNLSGSNSGNLHAVHGLPRNNYSDPHDCERVNDHLLRTELIFPRRRKRGSDDGPAIQLHLRPFYSSPTLRFPTLIYI